MSCLSLVDCDPVCCGKPFVALDVIDSILQVAITFCQIHLQQVSQQILQIRAEVGWKSHLEIEENWFCKTSSKGFYESIRTTNPFKNYRQETHNHAEISSHSCYLPRHNLLINLNRLICKEWRVASCHFIDEDSKGPPVHSFVIALKRFRYR